MSYDDMFAYGSMDFEEAKVRTKILVEALPWIKDMSGSTMVIKYGGAAMVDAELRAKVMNDIMLMKLVGVNPIIVHGGGNDISHYVEQLGLPVEFKDGLRVTTPEIMTIASMVLSGKVNEELVLELNRHGAVAVGLSGVDGPIARCSLYDEAHGRVGVIDTIDTTILNGLLENSFIPVLASIGVAEDGSAANINADSFAAAVAVAIGAQKSRLLDRCRRSLSRL